MGFHVDLKEFHEVLEKLQKDTSKTNNQLEQAKQALNGIIQADAMQGETGKAIVNDINNNQNTVVIGLKDTNELLSIEMAQTLQDFQSTTGETDENAIILEDALLQAQNKLSNLQPKKHEMDSRISNIYSSVSDLISLSMPSSQFDEKLVAASKELEDTIQKVQQFESKKEKSDAENILNALNNQVQIAGKMGSLSYTDPQLQAFFALDDLAKGIHEMDTQITKAKKEAKLQAEREMKKKQEEWAEHHPVEAWLQNFSGSVGEKWDVLRKGTKWVGENIPFLKGLADDALVLEGFLGAAGSAISGIAIGATKLGSLVLELGEWGFNSIRGVETEQWKLDDIYGAGNTLKNLGQAIISWQDYPKYGKTLFNSVKGYVEKALTDPYALGGAIFDIGSCFVGVGEVTAAVKGSAAFGKLAEGAKVFQVAEKSGKIVGKLEEVAAFMNKLPGSMKNVVEKIKNIEIPNLSPKPSLAGVGNVGEGNTLGRELFSVAKSETKGQAQNANRLSGEKFDNPSLNIGEKTPVENAPVIEKKSATFFDGLNLKNGAKVAEERGGKAWDEIFKNTDFPNIDNEGLKNLIEDINKSSLSPNEKILANIEAYNKAVEAGVKTDIQVISSTNCIDSITGKVKWPEAEGYVVDRMGNAIKEEISPKVGDVMDRYGSVYGTYTSPFNGTKGYSFSERALPYIENPNVYHKYEVIRDFKELKEVIETWPDKGLVDEFFMDAKAYGYDMDNFTSFAGEIAPAFDAVGGGIQWKLPMSIEYLEEFGFIKEIKVSEEVVGKAWDGIFKNTDFSNIDNAGLKNLIEDINKSSLSPNEKILANIEAYNKAVEAGVKTDIQVISSTNCIDSITGKVKWPEAEGYVVDRMGNAIKEEISPKVGDVMDRYGSVYGTYTSPFNDTKGYSFSERALPYIENPNVYHKYEVIRDFRELKEVIETWPDKGLVDEFFMDAKAYGYDMDNFTSFAGEIAPAFDAVGGGIQWKLPMSIEYLEEFGFIKETK